MKRTNGDFAVDNGLEGLKAFQVNLNHQRRLEIFCVLIHPSVSSEVLSHSHYHWVNFSQTLETAHACLPQLDIIICSHSN